MTGEFVVCVVELKPTDTEGRYCMFDGLYACESSVCGGASIESCAGSVAGVDGDGQTLVLLDDAVVFPVEGGGKSQVIAFCTVVVVGSSLTLLGTCGMPLVTGVTGPDNSESKRSIGFFAGGGAGSDAAFSVEGVEVFLFGVLGSSFSVGTSNMAQLLSFDCVVVGDVSGLLFFCSDGFCSTELLPPGGLIYPIQICQRFRISGNTSS